VLRCVRTYRNKALGLYLEAGEVLSEYEGRPLSPDLEQHLLRDAPGCFAYVEPEAEPGGQAETSAPSHAEMAAREQQEREVTERGGGGMVEGVGLRRV
jgi:hypothetical protein